MNAWMLLGAAIALETAWTFLLKLSDGFAKPAWGGLSILCYALCFWALAPAVKVIPVGIAYAIWAGVGIVAAAILGVLVFGEQLTLVQLACIALVLAGAIGLQLSTAH